MVSQHQTKVRDSQRIRVYRANSAVLGTPLPEMNDIRMFSNNVLATELWRNLFPDNKVWHLPTLKPGKGARSAHVIWHENGKIEIAFPRAYRYSTYVLHELAHFGLGADGSIASHGPEFVGTWLTLIREFCNARTVEALERSLDKNNVNIKLPFINMSQNMNIQKTKIIKPEFSYDEKTNTVLISSDATYIDLEQLEFFS